MFLTQLLDCIDLVKNRNWIYFNFWYFICIWIVCISLYLNCAEWQNAENTLTFIVYDFDLCIYDALTDINFVLQLAIISNKTISDNDIQH